jgi:hypothetical protein
MSRSDANFGIGALGSAVDPADIEAYDPPEGWGWCYVDEVVFDLRDRATPQRGPIPKFV